MKIPTEGSLCWDFFFLIVESVSKLKYWAI